MISQRKCCHWTAFHHRAWMRTFLWFGQWRMGGQCIPLLKANYTCSNGSTPDNGEDKPFRSLINNDEYASLHPPCANFTDQGCDSYAAIYLNGDPNDGTFDSGIKDTACFMKHYNISILLPHLFLCRSISVFHICPRWNPDIFVVHHAISSNGTPWTTNVHTSSQDACWREMILTTWGKHGYTLNLHKTMHSWVSMTTS